MEDLKKEMEEELGRVKRILKGIDEKDRDYVVSVLEDTQSFALNEKRKSSLYEDEMIMLMGEEKYKAWCSYR